MNITKLLLYFHTVKYLKSRQFVYNFIRRLSSTKISVEVNDIASSNIKLKPFIKYFNKINESSVCFLNKTRDIESVVDWNCIDEPKLWRYNLHYFDFLLDDGASIQTKDRLIDSWIDTSHGIKEDAWEPYPISLRVVNWIKYFVTYKDNPIPKSWVQSLYQQVRVLNDSIEYHILANHYLKNGKGLLFAAAYLDCPDAKKWYDKGRQILVDEAGEQILDDGGHYEKSPMYHSIVVEDYLDVLNLIQSNNMDIPQQDIAILKNTTLNALKFFDLLVMPDGEIPLFNDSAFNIASCPDKLFEYANRVLGYVRKKELPSSSAASLESSGYFVISSSNSKCVIDCGSISPDYQPGHTHCDVLSYELAIDGQRCIVNSGLYDYEDSEERRYCRSTRAHNTVEIDGKEQSEIWGQFRVARRAKVLSASLEQEQESGYVFNGSYSPYWGVKENIVHSREVNQRDEKWIFSDEITGHGEHTVRNFIHIHPDIDCVKENDGYILVNGIDKLAKITFSDAVNVSLEEDWYYPEFGIKKKNIVLQLFNHGRLPINQAYVIETL